MVMQRREEVRTTIGKKNSVTIYNCGSSFFSKYFSFKNISK
jgi:hypothetical protein